MTTSSEWQRAVLLSLVSSSPHHLRIHFSILRPFVKILKRMRCTTPGRRERDSGRTGFLRRFQKTPMGNGSGNCSKKPRKGINLLPVTAPHKPIHEVMGCKNHLSVHARTHMRGGPTLPQHAAHVVSGPSLYLPVLQKGWGTVG